MFEIYYHHILDMKRFYLVSLLYIICILTLYIYKPAMMFNADGSMKHFDYDETNNEGSLFNIEISLGIIAIFCYFVVISLECVISNK